MYVVHRPVSAGNFILKSEAELLRERRQEEAKERQRKVELAKQKKAETAAAAVDAANAADSTKDAHPNSSRGANAELDPGSNQPPSTRPDRADEDADQTVGGRSLSYADTARPKLHGRHIIARSAILQAGGGIHETYVHVVWVVACSQSLYDFFSFPRAFLAGYPTGHWRAGRRDSQHNLRIH